MGTLTTNYNFSKPTVGGDVDAWGTQLNGNWDKVEALFSGDTTADGMVLTGANITATSVNLSVSVTIEDATFVGTSVETDTLKLNKDVTEKVYTVSGTTPGINPTNGTIQLWTLSANSTPTFTLGAGKSVTLGITAGAFSVTWPGTIKWIGGLEPTLDGTNIDWITFWQAGSTIYASHAGAAS